LLQTAGLKDGSDLGGLPESFLLLVAGAGTEDDEPKAEVPGFMGSVLPNIFLLAGLSGLLLLAKTEVEAVDDPKAEGLGFAGGGLPNALLVGVSPGLLLMPEAGGASDPKTEEPELREARSANGLLLGVLPRLLLRPEAGAENKPKPEEVPEFAGGGVPNALLLAVSPELSLMAEAGMVNSPKLGEPYFSAGELLNRLLPEAPPPNIPVEFDGIEFRVVAPNNPIPRDGGIVEVDSGLDVPKPTPALAIFGTVS